MNSSILSFLIALGLPGSSACTAQQSGLPRLGQTPPAAEQPAQPSTAPAPLAKAQTVDADDDSDEADADDEMDVDTDEPEEMAVEEVELPESAEAFVFGDIDDEAQAFGSGPACSGDAPKCEVRCETTPGTCQDSCTPRAQAVPVARLMRTAPSALSSRGLMGPLRS